MNWYKKAKYNLTKEAAMMEDVQKWLKYLGLFGAIGYIGAVGLVTMDRIIKEYPDDPIAVKKQIINEINNKNINISQPSSAIVPEINPEVIEETIQPGTEDNYTQEDNSTVLTINLDKILQIESTGGINNWNKDTRARGPYQFVKKTWKEIVNTMGQNWDWWTDSMDMTKSRQVSDFYYNIDIPRMLKYYKIPDSFESRIAAYNWGIGNLYKLYQQYGNEWINYLPQETLKYIKDYTI